MGVMMAQNTDFRDDAIWTPERQQAFNRIVLGALLIGLGVWIGSLIFGGDEGYATNVYTEVLSIAVTVGLLDYLNRRRDERRRIEDLKEQLLRDVRSQSNETAKNAVHQLRARGWLQGENGLLKGAQMSAANLQDAFLVEVDLSSAALVMANLQRAFLNGAKLNGSYLISANLQGARLSSVDLQGANLLRAKLQGAVLSLANLQDANLNTTNIRDANLIGADLRNARLDFSNLENVNLQGAKLQGTNLQEANLQAASFRKAQFSETTTLPDGSQWKPETDIARFTNPRHLHFWRSKHPASPAYRGAVHAAPPGDKSPGSGE